jgi:hypothetical protein
MNTSRTTKTTLTVRLEHEFTDEMAALRRSGWSEGVAGAVGDAYDRDSHHLAVRVEGRAIALVRITPGPGSALSDWSHGRAPLPQGPAVAELTRGVVAPAWRRVGLYRLAMLESMLRLRALGVTTATAAVEPDFCGRHFLARVGFLPVGAPVVFDDHPRQGTVAQCIQARIALAEEEGWHELRRQELLGLVDQGYVVDSDLPDVASSLSLAGQRTRGRNWVHESR